MDFVRGAAERFHGKEWFVGGKLEYLDIWTRELD